MSFKQDELPREGGLPSTETEAPGNHRQGNTALSTMMQSMSPVELFHP